LFPEKNRPPEDSRSPAAARGFVPTDEHIRDAQRVRIARCLRDVVELLTETIRRARVLGDDRLSERLDGTRCRLDVEALRLGNGAARRGRR
jgi:hypothetical protein